MNYYMSAYASKKLDFIHERHSFVVTEILLVKIVYVLVFSMLSFKEKNFHAD